MIITWLLGINLAVALLNFVCIILGKRSKDLEPEWWNCITEKKLENARVTYEYMKKASEVLRDMEIVKEDGTIVKKKGDLV